MSETGSITKKLLNSKPKENTDEPITYDFGDMTNIELPYNKNNYVATVNFDIEEDEKKDEDKYYFCDYVLYFALLIIILGYIGYYIVNKKILSYETVSGINLGVTFGLIVINLIWSNMND